MIKSQTRELFAELAIACPEFQQRVKRVVPSIEVYPYRLMDGGHPVLRARITLDLGATPDGSLSLTSAVPSLQRVLVVDLFDPPQRAAYLKQIVELRKSNTQRVTAAKLGLAVATIENAMSLHRRMTAAGPVRSVFTRIGTYLAHILTQKVEERRLGLSRWQATSCGEC